MAGRILKKKNDNSPPKEPRIGQVWYDDTTRSLRRWNGQHWGTEMKPGDYAKRDAEIDPVTRLLARVEAELNLPLTAQPSAFRAHRIKWHGMHTEFVTKNGGHRALHGELDALVTGEKVIDLLKAPVLACEISSARFTELHGVRLFILSIGKVE